MLDALVEHACDAILRHDASLRCVYANATYLAASGASLQDLGKTQPDGSLLLGAPGYRAGLARAQASGAQQSTEIEWADQQGRQH
ncbi:hypothetical protein, partial [Aquabacterium sp.]|uniref:hypothetical protein n=1 Tax=Aquabacterium sp. TaxID=1872578 RepID=UPI0035B19971